MDKNTLISSFGKWVAAPINFKQLQESVEEIELDKYPKKLTTVAYLLAFLHALLHEKKSLRAISDVILDENLQKALGLESISFLQKQ
jgi:hypothetical protein